MKRLALLTLAALAVFCLAIGPAAAGESEKAEEGVEGEYPSKIVLFGGLTQGEGEIGPSIGLEYTYRLWKPVSIGVLGEYAGGDFDLYLLGVDFIFHPHADWFIRLAPAAEFEHSETRLIFRTGAGYEFDIAPRWALAPEFNVDLNRREEDFTLVYGLSLIYKF